MNWLHQYPAQDRLQIQAHARFKTQPSIQAHAGFNTQSSRQAHTGLLLNLPYRHTGLPTFNTGTHMIITQSSIQAHTGFPLNLQNRHTHDYHSTFNTDTHRITTQPSIEVHTGLPLNLQYRHTGLPLNPQYRHTQAWPSTFNTATTHLATAASGPPFSPSTLCKQSQCYALTAPTYGPMHVARALCVLLGPYACCNDKEHPHRLHIIQKTYICKIP